MRILYFAWVKEKIGRAEEEVQVPLGVTNVTKLVEHLRTRTPSYAAAFADVSRIQVAINQKHVAFDYPISPADEVAFFPPMTGG